MELFEENFNANTSANVYVMYMRVIFFQEWLTNLTRSKNLCRFRFSTKAANARNVRGACFHSHRAVLVNFPLPLRVKHGKAYLERETNQL